MYKVQAVFLTIKLLTQLYLWVGILLACRKHDSIMSLRREGPTI